MASSTPSGSGSAYDPSTKTFSILGKNLKATSAADLEPYLSELKSVPAGALEKVIFGGNSLGVEACESIAAILKDREELQVADFSDIFTGRLISEIPQALSALCDALKDHKTLVELDLSDNAFGGRCADAMVPFLRDNRSIQVFKLNNNGLGIWGGKVISDALLENAKSVKAEKGGEVTEGGAVITNLRTVVCGRNRLENGSANHWAEAFAAHAGLKEVRLPQNGIRMEGIHLLAQGLAQCPNLEVLDLQDNTATESGTRSIAAAMPSWPNLKQLNLSDCLLSPKGGISLATALEKGSNPKLEVLRLQYGEIDARALHTLAKAIEHHGANLTTLELNGNRADPEDECIERIKEALAAHGHADALDEREYYHLSFASPLPFRSKSIQNLSIIYCYHFFLC